jgi:hypothetical protein
MKDKRHIHDTPETTSSQLPSIIKALQEEHYEGESVLDAIEWQERNHNTKKQRREQHPKVKFH